MSELNTIEQFLAHAKNCFLRSDNLDKDDAKIDARALLSAVVNKPLSYLSTWPEKHLSAEQSELMFSFIERRLKGEPVAYITGKREFWSLEFFVAPCTLIPRADTETLVEAVLDNNADAANDLSVLDLGTGTGAIALALASEQPNWQIEALDFNDEAVLLANHNAKHLQLSQVKIYQSDWFSAVANDKRFDVIVSNPPYIDENDTHLTEGDLRFEPKSALVANGNGLSDIKHIIDISRQHLAVNGQLYLEHGFEQHLQVQQLLSDYGFKQIKTFTDFGGNPRITMGYFT